MIVFRLSKSIYSRDLTGKGAEQFGGRWNEKGFPMLYTSGSRALCLTEIAVHVPFGIIPTDFVLTTIEIEDDAEIQEINEDELPENWKIFPHPPFTKKIGTTFLNECNQLILKVPSAVVQGEFNYLINPNHPSKEKVSVLKTEPFFFDERLFR